MSQVYLLREDIRIFYTDSTYVACIFLSDKKLLLILHCNCLLLLNQYILHICKHAGWLGNNCHRRHDTMGQGSKKIDLSPSKIWDIFLNDQNKLLCLWIYIVMIMWNCAVSVKPVKICSNWLITTFICDLKMQSKLLGSIEFALVGYLANSYAV